MRDIKFRAFGGNTMGIVTGFDDQFSSVRWGNDEVSCDVATEDIRLMQYTGLKDKNGKEIWEGDVLKVAEHYPASGGKWTQQIAAVSFESGCFVIRSKKGLFATLHGIASISEVIGNIHENPELIQCQQSTPA